MKKFWLAIIISALVFATTIIWLLNTVRPVGFQEIAMFGAIFIIAGFGLFVGISRYKSARAGEPSEDELSKKILQMASSRAYYISLYMWLVLGYFIEIKEYETHTIIGIGIIGMAILFFACMIYYKIRGLKDA